MPSINIQTIEIQIYKQCEEQMTKLFKVLFRIFQQKRHPVRSIMFVHSYSIFEFLQTHPALILTDRFFRFSRRQIHQFLEFFHRFDIIAIVVFEIFLVVGNIMKMQQMFVKRRFNNETFTAFHALIGSRNVTMNLDMFVKLSPFGIGVVAQFTRISTIERYRLVSGKVELHLRFSVPMIRYVDPPLLFLHMFISFISGSLCWRL